MPFRPACSQVSPQRWSLRDCPSQPLSQLMLFLLAQYQEGDYGECQKNSEAKTEDKGQDERIPRGFHSNRLGNLSHHHSSR
jgi:hypothetical protein